MDQLTQALLAAAGEPGERTAPPRVWHVGPEADVRFRHEAGGHPFDGMTIRSWIKS